MNNTCQKCKQARATVHITDVIDKRDRHLCDECAEREGVIVKHGHQTTNAILQEFIKQKTGLGAADAQTCPRCGISFREFRLKGLLGCPFDYEAFRNLLLPLIERAHQGGKHHVGKSPLTTDDRGKKISGLRKLRRELQEALDQENYELAARVRDQLRDMESTES